MFDYNQLASLLFLIVTFVFTIYNWLLFTRQQESNFVLRYLYYFNLFVLFHTLYNIVSNLLFVDDQFLNLADPLVLFYAPFYITILKAESQGRDEVKKLFILFNFFLAFVFTGGFVFLMFNKSNFESLLISYTQLLYGLIGVQMLSYTLWGMFIIQKNRVVGRKTRIWNLFFDGLLLLFITGTFFLTGVYKVDKILEGTIEDNNYITDLFMLLAVIVIHRVCTSNLESTKEKLRSKTPTPLKAPAVTRTNDLEIKYAKSRIDKELLEEYAEKIKSLGTAYFLVSSLNIEKLSEDLRISTHHLAQTFSIIFDTNYNQYVNNQRIMYATSVLEEQLRSGEENKTVSEIAFLSGFNSDSSFYRAFREYYGMSPSQWKKKRKEIIF